MQELFSIHFTAVAHDLRNKCKSVWCLCAYLVCVYIHEHESVGAFLSPRLSASFLRLTSSASCRSCSACWAMSSLATLDVMMKIASLHSMVFPLPSVRRPWEREITLLKKHLKNRTSRSCLCLYTHLVKELQHDRQNIRVGLVYFIKQDNGIGTRLQQLGQLTSFLMSHVSRRGANELGHLRDERGGEQSKKLTLNWNTEVERLDVVLECNITQLCFTD